MLNILVAHKNPISLKEEEINRDIRKLMKILIRAEGREKTNRNGDEEKDTPIKRKMPPSIKRPQLLSVSPLRSDTTDEYYLFSAKLPDCFSVGRQPAFGPSEGPIETFGYFESDQVGHPFQSHIFIKKLVS